jgi:hypothetical protein
VKVEDCRLVNNTYPLATTSPVVHTSIKRRREREAGDEERKDTGRIACKY